MTLVDTNIIIDYTKGSEDALDFLNGLRTVTISAVTAAEIYQGARDKTELRKLDETLQRFAILPLTEELTEEALSLLKKYTLSHGLLILDALIAATAITHNAKLTTLNTKHFKVIDGLTVARPY